MKIQRSRIQRYTATPATRATLWTRREEKKHASTARGNITSRKASTRVVTAQFFLQRIFLSLSSSKQSPSFKDHRVNTPIYGSTQYVLRARLIEFVPFVGQRWLETRRNDRYASPKGEKDVRGVVIEAGDARNVHSSCRWRGKNDKLTSRTRESCFAG